MVKIGRDKTTKGRWIGTIKKSRVEKGDTYKVGVWWVGSKVGRGKQSKDGVRKEEKEIKK